MASNFEVLSYLLEQRCTMNPHRVCFVGIINSVESVYIIDWPQLEKGESAKEVTPVRIYYKEVVILRGKWRYPVREGSLKQPDPGQKRSLRRRVIQDSDPGDEENEGEEE
eukprot:7678012-Karenia_brevis.AAC.1